MIKKINIALVVVFILMMLLKMLSSGRKEAESTLLETPVEIASEDVSQLAPRVYFSWWPPFCKIDPISKHNGFILDQMRAIFPNAEFVEVPDTCSLEDVLQQFRQDPRGVVCTMGDSIALNEFSKAPTSFAWFVLRVLTPRSSPWKYTGPDSLKRLRLCGESALMDSHLVQQLIKDRGIKFVFMKFSEVMPAFERGEIDGVLEAGSSDWADSAYDMSSFEYEKIRYSPPLEKVQLVFRASNCDTNFAAEVIRDYEAGFKRIKESGIRRRICEYYGFKE